MTDYNDRFLASEIIREKIFEFYGEEIPYSTTVEIEEYKEREKGKDFIKAIIYVERGSQKGILIGKNGEAIKRVGVLAREEMEKQVDRKVYLELVVKVMEKWRKDKNKLKKARLWVAQTFRFDERRMFRCGILCAISGLPCNAGIHPGSGVAQTFRFDERCVFGCWYLVEPFDVGSVVSLRSFQAAV